MNAILYLYEKTLKNRIKKALKRPITYIYVVMMIFYLVIILVSFGPMIRGFGSDPAYTLTAFLTVAAFIFTPANLISYSKRKGLVFRQSDVHLMFPSPIGSKIILLYAHAKTVLGTLALNLILVVGGVLWFEMPVWKMLVYFLFSCIVENILEASLMILCYGTERLNKKHMLVVQLLMYALIGSFVVIGAVMYFTQGASISVVFNYLNSPAIQMVPIIGWYIAFIHFLFIGPAAVNIFGSVLFFTATAVLFTAAVRMKCTGEYYEDAIKFAEDYETAREKGRKGEVAVFGRKQKFGKATVSYKGNYAKALFYRQLLEYKKNRFFIFGFNNLLCITAGVVLAVLGYRGELGDYALFAILGVMAYVTFIFASYAGKWGKELEKPYTYLIPDSSFHKLWYATLIEHIRAIADGCLITLPVGIILKLPFIQILLIILIYVCLQACKLYATVMVEALLGNMLGTVGKQFARLFFEGIVIGIGILGAVIGTLVVSAEAGFVILIILSAVMTGGMMAVASLNFERMETLE